MDERSARDTVINILEIYTNENSRAVLNLLEDLVEEYREKVEQQSELVEV